MAGRNDILREFFKGLKCYIYHLSFILYKSKSLSSHPNRILGSTRL